MVATSKEAVNQILTEVIQLGVEDVEALDKKLWLKYMRNFSRFDYDDLVDCNDLSGKASIKAMANS